MASLITKGTTPRDHANKGTVNFVKVENLDADSGDITPTTKVSLEEHVGYLKRSQLEAGDILFSIAGTLGRVGVVNTELLPANTNQALAIIRVSKGNINFLRSFLKSAPVSNYIKKNPTVGAQPNLSLEQVSHLNISLPTEREQKKVGDFFVYLETVITLHQRNQIAHQLWLEKIKLRKKGNALQDLDLGFQVLE